MNGIIIYKGKYGATRQYAEWLGNNLSIPITTPEELQGDSLARMDYLVIGSSVYIGKLQVKNWLAEHADSIIDKKIFLFIVCGTPPHEKEKLDIIAKNNIPDSLAGKCSIYFLHGRMLMKNLSLIDRWMLKIGASLQKDPIAKKNMLQEFDDVKIEHIVPLQQAITSWCIGENNKKIHADQPIAWIG